MTARFEHHLDGLPGDNPLGFMAALGALLVSGRALGQQEVTLSWSMRAGGWRPTLGLPEELSQRQLAELLLPPRAVRLSRVRELAAAADAAAQSAKRVLEQRLELQEFKRRSPEYRSARAECDRLGEAAAAAAQALKAAEDEPREADPITDLGEHLKAVDGKSFREFASQAARAAAPLDRRLADFAAAFGCELLVAEGGVLEPTRFSKQNGNSGKAMLKDLKQLAKVVTVERTVAALFLPWDYADERLSLGWDPVDVRPYAHQWADPGADASSTMHAANLLAFEGLRLFPTAPQASGRLVTSANGRIDGPECLSWALWACPLTAQVIRGLLTHPFLQEGHPDRQRLGRMGLQEIYRAQHFSFFKSPRFRPARAV